MDKIDLAQTRLGKGDYGFCSACDEPINPQRLAIDPTTATCIKCAGGNT